MTESDLHAAIARLRRELRGARFRDPQSHQQVESLIREIEANRATSAPAPSTDALLQRIGETVRRLEVEHPVLTGCLGQIAAALSAMGI